MSNYFETDLIGTEYFEEIFELLFDVSLANEKELEEIFFTVAGTLERRIQDLEDYSQESKNFASNILIRLKFWSEVLKQVKNEYNQELINPLLTVKSYLYAISNLENIATSALKSKKGLNYKISLSNLAVDLKRCGPVPPNEFIHNVEHNKKYKIYNPLYFYARIIHNYFFKKYHFFIKGAIEDKYSNLFLILKSEVFNYDEKPNTSLINQYIEELVSNKSIQNLPTFIYLDTDNRTDINNFYKEVLSIIGKLGFETNLHYPERRGSWFKKLFSSAKEKLNSEELQDRLKKVEHAVELNTIKKQQSEVDKNQAEALSSLLKASENIPNIATLIGSLLFIKSTDQDGIPVVFCKTLTTKEMIFINDNPGLISDPKELLIKVQNGLIEQSKKE